jgi:predicted RecA/RadA family phage recombinase
MAKNMVQAGDVVSFTAPTGGVVSGQGVAINSLFGVSQYDAAEGAQGEMAIEGCHYLPATGAIAFGAPAYWTGTAVTATATGNLKIGVCTEAASGGYCVVKITPGAA